MENPKESIKKLLEQISQFHKVTKYISTHRKIVFLYTSNVQLEIKIKTAIQFTITLINEIDVILAKFV